MSQFSAAHNNKSLLTQRASLPLPLRVGPRKNLSLKEGANEKKEELRMCCWEKNMECAYANSRGEQSAAFSRKTPMALQTRRRAHVTVTPVKTDNASYFVEESCFSQ